MKICMYLKRPRFEVLAFPADELKAWSLYFHIEQNGFGEVNNSVMENIPERSPEELRESFKGIFG